MNNQCHQFVNFVISEAPSHNKKIVEDAVCRAFNLVKDRKVYHNDCFAVRFSYSKSSSSSFSNTVLSLSALEKYDRIPFFVVLVRQNAENLIFLANSTLLKKISHSSQELSMTNIKGSFNGSDIIRDYEGVLNSPENFDYLFAIHQGLDWDDNLLRLVESTSNIKASATLEYPHLLKRPPSPWRALRDFRSLKGFCSVFPSIHFESHPESSSNSICKSPFRSLAQFRPLHLP